MKKLFTCLLCILIYNTLLSQQSDSIYSIHGYEIGEIKTVISHVEIQMNCTKTLSQLLNDQAGFVINGAYQPQGSFVNIYSEGSLGPKMLVLIDGLPVWDPSSISESYFDLNIISLNEIEEIEIYRGANASTLGSGAVCGTINIITRKKQSSKTINLKATQGFGNLNTSNFGIQLWGDKNKFKYQASYSTSYTNGFSISQDTTGVKGFDIDGFKNKIFNSRIEFNPNHNLLLYGYCLYSKYKASTDIESFVDSKDYFYTNKLLNTGIGGIYLIKKTNIIFDYKVSNAIRDYHYAFYDKQHWGGLTQFIKTESITTLSKKITLSLGIDYKHNALDYFTFDTIAGDTYKNFPSLYQYGVYTFLNFQSKDSSFNCNLKARINNHSSCGKNNAYSLYGKYRINSNFKAFASIATGILTPSIFELYTADFGNSSLSAESSTTADVGFEFHNKSIKSKIRLFNNHINSIINFNFQTSAYANWDNLNTKGVEYEFESELSKIISLNGNYTFITGKEETTSRQNYWDMITYKYLARRPKNIANINVTFKYKTNFSLTLNGRYVGNFYEVGVATDDIKMKEYFLLNLNSNVLLLKGLSANLGIQNLLNNTFHDSLGYNSIPLIANASISITF